MDSHILYSLRRGLLEMALHIAARKIPLEVLKKLHLQDN